jgi:hypothetical protein
MPVAPSLQFILLAPSVEGSLKGLRHKPAHRLSFRTKQADTFFPFHSCERSACEERNLSWALPGAAHPAPLGRTVEAPTRHFERSEAE